MIDDKIYCNLILDFYDFLLTKRQNEILNLYYKKDYSMNEIADVLKITKSAVSDTIRKSMSSLIDYENKFLLVKNFEIRKKLYKELEELKIKEVDMILGKLRRIEK